MTAQTVAVDYGDIWQVGKHFLCCGDIEQNHAERFLATGRFRPDIVYTDPPWGAALATGFRTKAGLSRQVDYAAFLAAFADSLQAVPIVFVEMGAKWEGQLHEALNHNQYKLARRWEITYYRTRRAILLAYTKYQFSIPILGDFTGLDDADTPLAVLQKNTSTNQVVFDPCTGKGLTALAADKLHLQFIGMELSPTRLAVGIERLCKQGNYTAQKIQSLAFKK
ncbi:MAG: hypothetical protein HXX08_11240 [Chloroflexi bacterium]|uniref:Methyltransferase n=1 Tax=Candidatus Chlorohelix allophototropha TaxID=3003348 RepID=A0A8T7LZC3_9CHLR|nr:hypothetical protein [Chloroflexota bacterium]WJW65811.1 hypothetical protein OZ401_001590 [Chloroflexota bacterium L227-S17]